MKNSQEIEKTDAAKFIEDVDFYFENGFMILTEHFLKKRGYCCKNGCRHCPYSKETNELLQQKSF